MITVIIPTLNEEDNIRNCIESIKSEDGRCEIIIADGGSSDRTSEIAQRYANIRYNLKEEEDFR